MRELVTAFLSVALAVVMGNIIYALRRRRIMWGHFFTKQLWAEQQHTPTSYWLLVALNVGIAGTLVWMLLTDPNSVLS
jgi:hypothetical protein